MNKEERVVHLDPSPVERGFIKASDFINEVLGSFEAILLP